MFVFPNLDFKFLKIEGNQLRRGQYAGEIFQETKY
jgi:hypothetical protein